VNTRHVISDIAHARVRPTQGSVADPEPPLSLAFVICVAIVAIALVCAGGYAIWFGLGPASSNHAGMPFLALGALLIVVGGLAGLVAAHVSREWINDRDRDA
jgi:hypothetical protein